MEPVHESQIHANVACLDPVWRMLGGGYREANASGVSKMSSPYDPRRPVCIASGSVAGGFVSLVGAAIHFGFDGQSLPAVLLIGLLGVPVGAFLGWIVYSRL